MAKAPIDARTLKQICDLPADSTDLGKDFWFIFDEAEATICKQRSGEESTAKVTMPRKLFDQLVRWYTTGKKRKQLTTPLRAAEGTRKE